MGWVFEAYAVVKASARGLDKYKTLAGVVAVMIALFMSLFGLSLANLSADAKVLLCMVVLAVFMIIALPYALALWGRKQKIEETAKTLQGVLQQEQQYWTAQTSLILSAKAAQFANSQEYALDLWVANRARVDFAITAFRAEVLTSAGWRDSGLTLVSSPVRVGQAPVKIAQGRCPLVGIGGMPHVFLRNVKLTVRREAEDAYDLELPVVPVEVSP